MASLAQHLSTLAARLEQHLETISVDPQAAGLTIETHSPGNGSTYTRLRARKGQKLPNGNRTMQLDAKEQAEWEQKIQVRNQRAKVEQCLLLLQQAADIAETITLPVENDTDLVKDNSLFTKIKDDTPCPPPKEQIIKYVLKDAKGATPMNRRVHAIAENEPKQGRWYTPALCGEQPKAGSWGWRLTNPSGLSCPRCHSKLKLIK